MSSKDANNGLTNEWSHGDLDLGPLAWVLDELRKSLDSSSKAIRRFVRDVAASDPSEIAAIDASALRIARQQLHQATGALEMVGMGPPSLLLQSMESVVQKYVQKPDLCTEDAASVLERASFALIDYLESVLAGKTPSPVALFPQYRDTQLLAGADRVHPADLWPSERRFREPEFDVDAPRLVYGSDTRSRLDGAVLRIVKTSSVAAAKDMKDICLGLVHSQDDKQARAFWKICGAFFDGLSEGLLPFDVYVKRVASRVLMQYASLAKGEPAISDRLVQDLLFFCAQAKPKNEAVDFKALQAVRATFGLDRFKPVDYETPTFGRYDPAVLTQARKRIAAATDTWSALAGGDRNKLKPAADQFSLVCDSLRKLHPGSENLAQSLARAVEMTQRSGEPPTAELAMEVATAVLYLQASFEELDAADDQMTQRANRLAERLQLVAGGKTPEPLEPWMEDLYRRVSDSQTMGSVVGELRTTLAEAEKALDQYFREPKGTSVLSQVPGLMGQMRGVLSVLGLDQASHAVVKMRDLVERLLINEVSEQERPSVFEKLGNSMGALGFLIDMLSYQRAMARKLFVFDEALGELRIVAGKARTRGTDAPEESTIKLDERSGEPLPDVTVRFPDPVASDIVDAPEPRDAVASELAQELGLQPQVVEPAMDHEAVLLVDSTHVPTEGDKQPEAAPSLTMSAPVVKQQLDVDDELLEIFLEEAREVVGTGLQSLASLRSNPDDLSEQTTLRRAFHTLKGSSRMVGLNEFGEAAWSMEQLLNAWLADQKPAKKSLIDLCTQAVQAFGRWVDDIAQGDATAWRAEPFRRSADAMRLGDSEVPFDLSDEATATAVSSADEVVEPSSEAVAQVDVGIPTAEDEISVIDIDIDEKQEIEFPDFQDTQVGHDDDASALGSEDAGVDIPIEVDAGIDFSILSSGNTSGFQVDADITEAATDAELPLISPDFNESPLPEPFSLQTAEGNGPEEDLPPLDIRQSELGVLDAMSVAGDDDKDSLPSLEIETITQEDATELILDTADSEAAVLSFATDDVPTADVDDAVKVIDTLRIGLPLYNVYLNEADEWSRRLVTCLQEWSLELHRPLPDTAVTLAHSLAGSSATVGFDALFELARLLEHAMQHTQLQSQGQPEQASVFVAAADEVRRLLHQFAAGFLKTASPDLLLQLRDILQTDVGITLTPIMDEPSLHGAELTTETGELDTATAALEVQEAPTTEAAQMEPDTVDADPVDADLVDVVASVQPEVPEQLEPGLELEIELESDVNEPSAVEFKPAVVIPSTPVVPALSSFHAVAQPTLEKAPSSGTVDVDDDIDAIDVIDPDIFPIFEEEAHEFLPQLGGALRQWANKADDLNARNEVLRALHTLKGSSRLAGAMRLGEMSHRLESAIEQLDVDTVQTGDIEPLLAHFDALKAGFDLLCNAGAEIPEESAIDAPPIQVAPPANAGGAVAKPLPPAAIRLPSAAQLSPIRSVANQSVRVRAQLLDRLVNQAGEVLISRSRLDVRMGQLRASLTDLSGNLDRLRLQLRDIELQAESQMQSRLALSKDSAAGFDPLEFDRFTRVQELTRMMAESVNDVATVQRNLQRAMEGAEDDLIAQGRQARELQRDLLRTRMVEFEGISERLYAVVRQSAKETGKQIKLDITGGSIEMDRGVLDRMTPAFEHLLRNCVAHGIEMVDDRVAAGKPAVGTIYVNLHQEGNDVSVEFRDDGAGLNIERIKDKALKLGLLAEGADLSDADAIELIYQPGFSTATEVTGLAGRGIGMDVVRAEINALGGRIETRTELGKGSSFRMVLPLTTAVTQVVMLRAGDLSIGVPANLVELVRRTPLADLEQAYQTGQFGTGDAAAQFFWAGALLQSSVRSQVSVGKNRPVVVFRSAAQRIALHVDEVLGNQEVVVKNLGPQLSRLPGLAGMSVLASGAVVLIYNPVALATVYGDQVRAASANVSVALRGEVASQVADSGSGGAKDQASAASGMNKVPLVLVVDDSITVRRVTQRLLQREGYRVSLAADGLQALERLQEERPTVVLSDIEMPRMDGFDLARNIRADAALRDLPIIMITSRIAEKHREHAMELGVNNYLGKPYSDEELLGLIQHYARLAMPQEA